MRARDLGTIVLRVFAVYLLLQVVSALPASISALVYLRESFTESRSVVAPASALEQWLWAASILWPVLLFAVVGLGLLRRAPKLAGRLVSERGNAPTTVVLDDRVQALTFSMVGMWLLASAAAPLARTIITLVIAARYRGTPLAAPYWARVDSAGLLDLAVSIAVGLWLCLGAAGIANVIRRFASAGPGRREEPPDGR